MCKYPHVLPRYHNGKPHPYRYTHILETRKSKTHTRRRLICRHCHKRWTDREPL